MQDIHFIVEFGSGGRDRTYDQLINSHNKLRIMASQSITSELKK